MREETGRWKRRRKIRDLLAVARCSQAVLDFISTTEVGRLVPPEGEGEAGSEVSEWELRELWEREDERRAFLHLQRLFGRTDVQLLGTDAIVLVCAATATSSVPCARTCKLCPPPLPPRGSMRSRRWRR